jgi:hypothetical protein
MKVNQVNASFFKLPTALRSCSSPSAATLEAHRVLGLSGKMRKEALLSPQVGLSVPLRAAEAGPPAKGWQVANPPATTLSVTQAGNPGPAQ